ncbi:SitI3 family protein [Micromonospora sp. WMMA1923]|uniref:SitI3 family protein n=1 Tax=Micromonospora sp. WMMA1923 TaxID=3404125 RepID=UPI003B949D04
MGIAYQLTLATDVPLQQVAGLVASDGFEESTEPGYPALLSADLTTQWGFCVSILGGVDGYVDAEDDGTQWEWKPDRYVTVIFDMARNGPSETATADMVAATGRVLAGMPQDAALVLNNNWLLLTRAAGRVRQHRRSWWHAYGLVEALTT